MPKSFAFPRKHARRRVHTGVCKRCTFTIGYDNLGRITSMARAAGTGAANTAPLPAQLATFTFDANGNRLTSSQSTGTGTTRLTTNRSYSVTPASNQIQSFSQTLLSGTATSGVTSSVNYQTDLNGAMLSDGLRRYEYDAANRLANVTTGIGVDAPTTRYVHNALGQRLFKTEPQYAPVASGSNPVSCGPPPAFEVAICNFKKANSFSSS
jgi:hypothetical protein